MTTHLPNVNALIEKHSLQIPKARQSEVTAAISNRLRNLDSNTKYRWREDNTEEEQAWLILTAICVARFYPDFHLDHQVCKAFGGSNHLSNIYPVPSCLNRAKSNRDWNEYQINDFIETANSSTLTFLEVPEDYRYVSAKEWVLNTFK